jgi:hypothetical protein
MSDDRRDREPEVERAVRRRRWRRRLKAAASLVLAAAAGTFLACVSRGDKSKAPAGPSPATGPDAGATVDAGEHRDGMPVPDNLVE